MMKICLGLLALCAISLVRSADYSGHKVITVWPNTEDHLQFLQKLREDHSVDLWNEPHVLDAPVMVRLRPDLIDDVERVLKSRDIRFDVAFENLQSVIDSERILNAPTNKSFADNYNFNIYNQYPAVENLIKSLAQNYPGHVQLETIGTSYENRPIYSLKISGGSAPNKPVIMMECGIHAREWSSVAAGAYFVNKLVTQYATDSIVKSLVDKYEFHIIVEANPDGYLFTWSQDRLWRKTRSRSAIDWLGNCRGADANRNFDIDHCGIGTSRRPCDEIYCGDRPFSESESRALRDMMAALEARMKLYVSLHAFSQFWMTPYGISKAYPPNYNELVRLGQIGVSALGRRYGTQYKLGSIANIIYEATGSSVDYAYVKHGVKIAYALELRDQGRFGFFLPQNQIVPMCEETYDGLVALMQAL